MSEENKIKLLHGFLRGANISAKYLNVSFGDNATFNQTVSDSKEQRVNVTEEQISKAILAINGANKPLNEKQLFLGVIRVLLSKYGWVGTWSDCCVRINKLPMKDQFEKVCDYNCIKVLTAYKFASIDYLEWGTYKPRPEEKNIFLKCKNAADEFDKTLLTMIETTE